MDTSWRFRRQASFTVGGQYGVGAGLGLALARGPMPGPVPRGARLSLFGRYGITGSRDLALTFEAPGVSRDWRVLATVRSERMLRSPYFGTANEHQVEDSLQDRYGNRFYRYALLRSTAWVTAQRRLAGSLWLSAGAHARRWRASELKESPTLFQLDAGVPNDTQIHHGTELRGGLVWDTRNDWGTPTRGLLLEALVTRGRLTLEAGPRRKYTRLLLGARQFVPLAPDGRTVLALRQRVTVSADSLPHFLAWEQPSVWAPEDGIFSRRTIRLQGRGDELASSWALLSVDLRRVLIPPDWLERPRRLWVHGFVDAGTLWEPGREPLRRMTWSVGTGFRLQIGRAFLAGVDAGITSTGPHASVGSQFAY